MHLNYKNILIFLFSSQPRIWFKIYVFLFSLDLLLHIKDKNEIYPLNSSKIVI